jgi:hypothetical protein
MFAGSHPNYSRTGGLILALSLAFAAQYLFTGEVFTRTKDSMTTEWLPRYTQASLLLLAALASAVWTFRQYHEAVNSAPAADQGPALPLAGSLSADWPPWVAGGAYVASLWLYLLIGENWLVRALWLASIALLVIPFWLRSRAHRDSVTLPGWEWALVALMTCIGFGLRYWRLTEIPSHLDQDIPFMGAHALRLIETANYNWIGFSDSNHLLSYDQSLAWSMRLFGQDHYGLVMESVIFGTLTVPALFLLGREMFGRRVGLIAAALLAFSYTHIHFSRILFGPSSTLFAVITFYFLFRGLRTRSQADYALAGVSGGAALLFYDSSRVIPIIALALFGWRLIWQRQVLRNNLYSWIVFAIGGLVGFGPMLAFAFQDFELFVGRGNAVALWNPGVWEHAAGVYQTDSAAGVWLGQIRSTFLAFHLYGDGSPHFAFPRPMVAALTAALFVMGLAYCLLQMRNARHFFVLEWFLLTFVLGGVITYDPPYWPHLNIALPAVGLIAAIAADKLILLLPPWPSPWSRRVAGSLMAVAILLTGVHNWQVYYEYVEDNAGVRSQIARFVNGTRTDYQVYMLSDMFRWSDPFFQFLNKDVQGEDLTAELLRATPPPVDRPLLFVLYRHSELVPFLKARYPGGLFMAHYDHNGLLSFESFEAVPPGYVAPARPRPASLLAMPGWWLVGAVVLGVAGRAAYSLRRRRPEAAIQDPAGEHQL